jgi:hypothetical protein
MDPALEAGAQTRSRSPSVTGCRRQRTTELKTAAYTVTRTDPDVPVREAYGVLHSCCVRLYVLDRDVVDQHMDDNLDVRVGAGVHELEDLVIGIGCRAYDLRNGTGRRAAPYADRSMVGIPILWDAHQTCCQEVPRPAKAGGRPSR